MTTDLTAWLAGLIAAADLDNADQARAPLPVRDCRTLPLLHDAPPEVAEQAALALVDFTAALELTFDQVRSDHVCRDLRVNVGQINVVVARLTVPGGPWPGHFGLEAVAFGAQPADMPAWFPPVHPGHSWRLHFGTLVDATRAFRDGGGAVLFPELMSLREARPEGQAFGVVFLDKLVDLYTQLVVALVHASPTGGALQEIRQLAFFAHEWGHLSVPPLEASAVAPRRRITSVIAEHHADLAALAMLADTATEEALSAAQVLVWDRIVREAWLNRADSQVQAIAARLLLDLLAQNGAVQVARRGVRLDLTAAGAVLAAELAKVARVLHQCTEGDLIPAGVYLGGRGLILNDGRWSHPALDIAHLVGAHRR